MQFMVNVRNSSQPDDDTILEITTSHGANVPQPNDAELIQLVQGIVNSDYVQAHMGGINAELVSIIVPTYREVDLNP